VTVAATSPRGAGVRVRRDPAAAWRHLDLVLLASVAALAAFGVLMVYSATQHRLEQAGAPDTFFLERQAVFVALGIVGMIAAALIDYRAFRDFAPLAYAGTILALLVVLTPLGSRSRGTQGWFQLGQFQLQPSELAKLGVVIAVAAYASLHRGDLDGRRVAVIVGIGMAPLGLIMLQPDLGTALVLVAVLLGGMLVAGVRPRHLAVLGVLGAVGVAAVLQLGVLKDYQLDRLGAFLDPSHDTQRAAYNLNQSKTAIASGGWFGAGLFEGPQTNLAFVPEQHTDFIFTVVGEEFGFAGAALLLTLFAVVVWRTWRAAALAKDLFGTLVCVGVLSMLVFQIFENVGMTMGIMPITGLPLPFLSYGGSSTLTSFLAIGLVLNVHMRRFS
jgi:rod shape determining protein RodA